MKLNSIKVKDVEINITLSLKELGTFITSLGSTSYNEHKESAQRNKVKIVDSSDETCELYSQLKNIYWEGAKNESRN